MGSRARALLSAVLDTSIIVRAYFMPNGPSARIIRFWQEGRYDLIVSDAVLAEYLRVLNYPRIQARHRFTDVEIGRDIRSIRQRAILVAPAETIDAIRNDESDNRFLECAIASDADFIVSADHHLLSPGTYAGIQIVTPAEFLAAIGERT